jgi:hypothetical protein
MTANYDAKMTAFLKLLNEQAAGAGNVFEVQPGRKYDKVFISRSGGRTGRYMVDRSTEEIYGIKSWAMINLRRKYGNLDSITDWAWFRSPPKVIPGTGSAIELNDRENEIKSMYKKRGRPRKAAKVSSTP